MILLLFFAFLAPFLYGAYEAGVDASKIARDAEKDSLKEGFHARNLIERSAVAVLWSGVLTLLLWRYYGFSGWFILPYLCYFAVAFGFWFTLSLNRARGLDAWYVSTDARAAVTDRLLVRFAPVFHTSPEHLARNVYTGLLLAVIVLFAGAAWINCLLIVDK